MEAETHTYLQSKILMSIFLPKRNNFCYIAVWSLVLPSCCWILPCHKNKEKYIQHYGIVEEMIQQGFHFVSIFISIWFLKYQSIQDRSFKLIHINEKICRNNISEGGFGYRSGKMDVHTWLWNELILLLIAFDYWGTMMNLQWIMNAAVIWMNYVLRTICTW